MTVAEKIEQLLLDLAEIVEFALNGDRHLRIVWPTNATSRIQLTSNWQNREGEGAAWRAALTDAD